MYVFMHLVNFVCWIQPKSFKFYTRLNVEKKIKYNNFNHSQRKMFQLDFFFFLLNFFLLKRNSALSKILPINVKIKKKVFYKKYCNKLNKNIKKLYTF